MTAVATAGLLAGLFGSALVPTAFAVRNNSNVSADDSYSFLENEGNSEDGYIEESNKGDMKKLQIASWSQYNTNDFAGIGYDFKRHGHDDFTDGADMSIGFYVEDNNGDAVETADLTATVTGGKVKVAFAYENDDQSFNSTCWTNHLQDDFKTTGDSVTGVSSDGDGWLDAGYYYLCIKPVSKTTLGTSTITVSANGVKIWTGTVQVLGDLKTITVSATSGYLNVAAGNDQVHNFFTIIGKDAAGQAINGKDDAFWHYLNSYTGNALTELGTADGNVAENAGGTLDFVTNNFTEERKADLLSDVCETADAGHTLSLGVEIENWAGDAVGSNELDVLCTGAQSTVKFSSPSLEYTSGVADWAAGTVGKADANHEIGIYVVAKDQNGRLMGVDASYGFNIDEDLYADFDGDLDLTEDEGTVKAGGKVQIGYIVPDMSAVAKYAIDVTIYGPDYVADDEDDLEATLYYTVTAATALDYSISRTRNAAKTQATFTADYGVACSGARIGFEWENNDGSKYGSVTRKANIDGVAKFVMNRRNTKIWVYATGCDNYSEDTDPIGARFK